MTCPWGGVSPLSVMHSSGVHVWKGRYTSQSRGTNAAHSYAFGNAGACLWAVTGAGIQPGAEPPKVPRERKAKKILCRLGVITGHKRPVHSRRQLSHKNLSIVRSTCLSNQQGRPGYQELKEGFCEAVAAVGACDSHSMRQTCRAESSTPKASMRSA